MSISKYPPQEAVLIVNPKSGRGRGKLLFPYIIEQFQHFGWKLTPKFSEHPKHIYDLVKESIIQKFTHFLVAGGDGSLNEVIQALFKTVGEYDASNYPIGIIPTGTGNSFLRDFGVTRIEEGIQQIIYGEKYKLDVMRYSVTQKDKTKKGGYALNIIGTGFMADVCQLANKMKFIGQSCYTVAALSKLAFSNIRHQTKIVLDGNEINEETNFIAVSNSKFTGGDMLIAPSASLVDGKLDIVISKKLSKAKIKSHLANIHKGLHVQDTEHIQYVQAKKIEIDYGSPKPVMVDGEIDQVCPLSVEVVAQALTVLQRI